MSEGKVSHLKLVRAAQRRLGAQGAPSEEKLRVPSWFSARRRKLWREAVSLAPPGLLRGIDAGALARYVVFWDIWSDAARRIAIDPDADQIGYLSVAPRTKTPMHSVLFSAMDRAAQGMRAEAWLLGFDPASRNRIGVKYDAPRKQRTAADEFLKQA